MHTHSYGGDGSSTTTCLGIVGGFGVSLALSLCLLSGCAGGTSSRTDSSSQAEYLQDLQTKDQLGSMTRLEILAEREAMRPSDPDREIADRILGGQLEELRVGSSSYGRAHRTVEEVLEGVLGVQDEGIIVGEDDGNDADEEDGAPLIPQLAKGYVRARAAMLDGDFAQAIAIYEQLIVAAPDSTDVLIGLGDAYMKAGNRVQAADSYLRAVNLGDTTTRALVYSAMSASSDPEQVIDLTGRVWAQERAQDQAGRLLSGLMLGQALIETGSYRAGAEVMSIAVAMLDGPAARDPRYRRELVQMYTKRGELLATAGDAWLVLGLPDRAMDAYARAGEVVADEPIELLRRRVAADLLSGQSAQGAMTLLEWIEAHPGNSSADLQDLIATISEHALVGEMIVGSLSEYVADDSIPASRRRSVLGLLIGIADRVEQDDQSRDPVRMVAGADPEVVSSVACQRLFASMGSQEEQIDAAERIIAESPSVTPVITRSLVRVHGGPAELLDRVNARTERSEALGLLSAMLQIQIGEVESDIDPTLGTSVTGQILSAQMLMKRGRYDQALGQIERVIEMQDRLGLEDRELLADTLGDLGRVGDAVEVARVGTELEPENASAWLLLGTKMIQASDASSAVSVLGKAIDLDPYDEQIYEQLILIRGSTGPASDVEALRSLTRSLGQRLPGSAMVGLIRAHELAGAANESMSGEGQNPQQALSLLSQAERVLIETHAQNPWREIGTDLLLSVWATQHSGGDGSAIVRGMDWLDEQLEQMPGSVDLAGARARLMVLAGDTEGAEDSLNDLHDRYPARAVGQLHEGLIRSDDTRRIEADSLALDRLEGLMSPEACLERLERAGGAGSIDQYSADMLIPTPGGIAGDNSGSWWYRGSDQLRIVRVLGALAQANPSSGTNDRVLELIGRTRMHATRAWPSANPGSDAGLAAGSENITLALNQIELLARAQSDGFEMDAYEALVRRSLADAGEGRDSIVSVAVQSLMRGQSLREAIGLQSRLVVDSEGMLDAQRAIDLFGTIGQVGSVEDLQNAVDAIDRAGLLVEARDAVVGGMGTINEVSRAPKEDLIGVRADLMYTAGVLASFYERESEGYAIYRAILEIDPDHAWANNDLGYKMVEDGGDLAEAEQLLIRAHEAEPNASSITDSLAWVRYALGVFDDELDGAGRVIKRGAKGLLVEALESEDGQENATIYDHLGDTLWMLGEFDQAIEAWLDAEDQIRERLTGLSNQPNANQTIIESMREELDSVRRKIADGESGRVPGVAPNAAGIPVPDGADDDSADTMDGAIDPGK
ncbi:MAG: tetratricopeptide repeat protein [Phycisphaerales bacterium]|nr:tetratricopeptide repeat protein [Phycisphaerales bacterium]